MGVWSPSRFEWVVLQVMAWVRLRPGTEVTEADLVGYCTSRIATFKIPRYWKFVAEFPMTVTGKVQKFRMRETAIAELGLVAAATVQTAWAAGRCNVSGRCADLRTHRPSTRRSAHLVSGPTKSRTCYQPGEELSVVAAESWG